ncbi:hypothetical protein DLM45_13375 [Hyphomicrobium methylovorum]|uniref:hypothetical protein n=1 Tax=Hyphomicrobium methylovorum TaxID=84 RepID=UPI0015E71A23|nr:hypothetical protein [Hyphomicrobium methylovorum]MBA2127205.1 hypothetical protein [Hyphomicrobium methylovorum]
MTGFTDSDPRRAAGYSNAALGAWMTGDIDGAVGLIETAAHQWNKSEDWIAELDISLAATGTAFHLMLAARHGEVFTRLRRAKLFALCRGAAAITKTIAQRLTKAPEAKRSTMPDDSVAALESAFGPNCAEIEICKRMMTNEDACGSPCELNFLGDRWSDEARRTPPEIRPLVDAAYLTAGLHRLPPMQQTGLYETLPTNREDFA